MCERLQKKQVRRETGDLALEIKHLRWRLNPNRNAKPATEYKSLESRAGVQVGDTNKSIIRIQMIFQDLKRSGLNDAVSMDRGVSDSPLGNVRHYHSYDHIILNQTLSLHCSKRFSCWP